jgi:hypothetical protein
MAGKQSIRADKTPPRKSRGVKQMVDIRGFALSTEQGAPLVTEKDEYRLSEYGADTAPSVVVDSESYQADGLSTANAFSKASPAALPIIERFAEQSEVSRSLLGINRETTQQGLFGNVSSYGLDPKDWRVDSGTNYGDDFSRFWWTRRPSSTGNYYPARFTEDDKNAAIVLSSSPTPFLEPSRPGIQDQLINPGGGERYTGWGQYINSIVALYIFRYVVENFSQSQWEQFNLGYLLTTYPPTVNSNGTPTFNELYWDKIWLDIKQNRFGPISNYPVIPSGRAYNFNNTVVENWRSNESLWGASGVIIPEATSKLPQDLNVSWDSFFFGSTRVYYPSGRAEDRGHYRIRTNPTPELWEKYFGLDWDLLRTDLKNWEFTIHPNESSVTALERDLKLPYFVLDTPVIADRTNNVFSDSWPSEAFGEQIDLPTNTNRIGGVQGTRSEITLKSIRSFRYQPGRISGFTYGVKVSEIGAGPGTTLEFGIENDTDSYMFRLSNGANFSVVRRSTVPLEDTAFLQNAKYADNTRTVVRNGQVQYETVIEQKIMNGDPLGGEGETGYILDPDTVTMYKIEFGWYGAIGARFYAYVPVENNECRWVTMHTLVIENQLGRPCLADPFFYFKYRLLISDSSTIRVDQYVNKFGASYYIDGYDEGTLYSLNAQSRVNYLPSPGFSESKTQLNAIDWTTLMGIKPRQFLVNRFGVELYNKKEIFPENIFVYSQQDCEIKIVRQKGCPEWAYTHQEGYEWTYLPASRRLKGKFTIDPFFTLDRPAIGISSTDAASYSAVAAYSTTSAGGFRDPTDPTNWGAGVIGSQVVRVVGDDLFALFPAPAKDFSGDSLVIKLQRDGSPAAYLSSRNTSPTPTNVYLPYLYSPVPPYQTGYDIEFDYFRRDQTLLSTVDVLSDEFYIYWVGGPGGGLDSSHTSSLRFGFVWPDTTDPGNDLYATGTDPDWGIEPNTVWDGQNFYEGLPYDFVDNHQENILYVETNPLLATDTFNLESGEISGYGILSDLGDDRLSVPGSEGGTCRGLFCKAGRELRSNVTILAEVNPDTLVTNYFVSDPNSPWPNLGESYTVTLVQGASTANISTSGGITRVVEDGVVLYLLPLGTSLPGGISVGDVTVFYNVVYIANIDKRSRVRQILVSKIAPGDVPFIRVFVQGRQGAKLGGVWIGQKTINGIDVRPFTPHRSTVSISDSGTADYHSEWSASPQLDGAVKTITTYTQPDLLDLSTAPTIDASESALDTYKSIHTNPRKCGSFLSSGGTNSAGIFTNSQYPLRYLTSPDQAIPLATYYVSANTPTEIDLNPVFNISAESIVNEDDGNLATFFIARSLNNHDESSNEIYLSLNYTEQ